MKKEEQRYVPTTKDQEFVDTLRQLEGKWVALSPNWREVVASGDSMEEVESKLDPSQLESVIFMKAPPANTFFIG